jgi:hypothetical protein
MPPIPFADNFLAGSIISLLFPILLLIGIAIWYVFGVRRFEGSGRSSESRIADGAGEAAPVVQPPADAGVSRGGSA